MLENSFIFLPGVGGRTEKAIWGSGVRDWGAFLATESAGPIKGPRKVLCDGIIEDARERLLNRDLPFFSRLMKPAESWRLWEEFGKGALFLDIETTGTRRYSSITVVGVWDGESYRALVRGRDLDRSNIEDLLDGASMLVTFNGRTFDIPMIEHRFPGSVPDIPHLDLRFLASRCGYGGGLKSLEIQLGMERPDDVKGMSGEDAVRLWHLFEREGNRNALKLLLKYNMEDIVNLEPITERLVTKMKEEVWK
ncbi:MAG: ribonuclease H-like domain-containing protein [Thermoplasmatota archaeon]